MISWTLVLALAAVPPAPAVRLAGYASRNACLEAGDILLKRYALGGASIGAIRASCEPAEQPIIR